MNESNLTLFKQALCEGLSNRIDHLMSECNEEVHCSKRHKIAMRTIIYGKIGEKRTITPKTRWIIAILVSAAIILTSCAIAYRDKIIRIIKYIPDYVMGLTYSEEGSTGALIETAYELTYVPEGYVLTESISSPSIVKYVLVSAKGEKIHFVQKPIQGTVLFIDEENLNIILTHNECDIYYSVTNEQHSYLWNDGKYIINLLSDIKLTNEAVMSIIDGIKVK